MEDAERVLMPESEPVGPDEAFRARVPPSDHLLRCVSVRNRRRRSDLSVQRSRDYCGIRTRVGGPRFSPLAAVWRLSAETGGSMWRLQVTPDLRSVDPRFVCFQVF